MQPPVTIQAAILQVLAAAPSCGKAIIARIKEHGLGYLHVAKGSVYEHLQVLEQQGLVIAALDPDMEKKRGPGRPPQRYSLTWEGQALAREHYLFLRRLLRYGRRQGV